MGFCSHGPKSASGVAPPDPLARLRGPTSKGRTLRGRNGKGREGGEMRGKGNGERERGGRTGTGEGCPGFASEIYGHLRLGIGIVPSYGAIAVG